MKKIMLLKKDLKENKKNKTLKRCLSCKNVEYNKRKIIYFHPGVYRQFNYSLN